MERGLKTGTEIKKIFLNISNGMFAKRVPEKTVFSKERTLTKGDNVGKTVHEEFFKEFVGRLTDIKINEHAQYGKSWEFEFDTSVGNEVEFIVLKCSYDSSYAKQIIGKLPNIDVNSDCHLLAYCFTPKGETKEKKGISLSQNGKKIPSAYTKEQPNGLPDMIKMVVKGKDVWDDTDQLLFLSKTVFTDFMPKLKTVSISTTEEEEENEELPF